MLFWFSIQKICKRLKNPEINTEITPLSINAAAQVFHVYAIAKIGNSVFNDQIVNSGPKIMTHIMAHMENNIIKHPSTVDSESFIFSPFVIVNCLDIITKLK